VLHDDGRLAGNVPAQMRRHDPRVGVVAPAWSGRDDQVDGLVAVELLRARGPRKSESEQPGEGHRTEGLRQRLEAQLKHEVRSVMADRTGSYRTAVAHDTRILVPAFR